MKKSDFIYGTFLTIGLLGVMAAGQILNSDLPQHNHDDLAHAATRLRNAKVMYDVAYSNACDYSSTKLGRDTLYQRLSREYNETGSDATLDSLNNYASTLFNQYMHECPDLEEAENVVNDARAHQEIVKRDCKRLDSLRKVPIKQRFVANWARLKNDIKSR